MSSWKIVITTAIPDIIAIICRAIIIDTRPKQVVIIFVHKIIVVSNILVRIAQHVIIFHMIIVVVNPLVVAAIS